MQAFMILIIGGLVVWIALHRQGDPPKTHPTNKQRTDLDGIDPHIKRAAELLDQLHELDDLLTSAELCAPRERAQSLRLEWTNHSGSTHSTKIWLDGNGSTQSIRSAAMAEREQLKATLLSEIRAAYSGDGVTETITGTMDSCCNGNEQGREYADAR